MKPAILVEYPFPIRQGQSAYFKIPINLTKEEVTKISRFLEALVRPEEENNESKTSVKFRENKE